MGRSRADQRKCLDGMIYRARTGCQWNRLPENFGSDSTVHRTVCRWDSKGVFDRLWAVLIYHCEDLQAVHWEWQAADGCMSKARFIGKKGPKPTVPDTAKRFRTKRFRTRQVWCCGCHVQRGSGLCRSLSLPPVVYGGSTNRLLLNKKNPLSICLGDEIESGNSSAELTDKIEILHALLIARRVSYSPRSKQRISPAASVLVSHW